MVNTECEVKFTQKDIPYKRKRKLYDDDNYNTIDNFGANRENFY